MKYKAILHYEHDIRQSTTVEAENISLALEAVFDWDNFRENSSIRSMSAGDLAEIHLDDPLASLQSSVGSSRPRYFLCCAAGWQEISSSEFKEFISIPFIERWRHKRTRECVRGVRALYPRYERGVTPED